MSLTPLIFDAQAAAIYNEAWGRFITQANELELRPQFMTSIEGALKHMLGQHVQAAVQKAMSRAETEIEIPMNIMALATEGLRQSPPKLQQQLHAATIFVLMQRLLIKHGFDVDGNKLTLHVSCTGNQQAPDAPPQPGGFALDTASPEVQEG